MSPSRICGVYQRMRRIVRELPAPSECLVETFLERNTAPLYFLAHPILRSVHAECPFQKKNVKALTSFLPSPKEPANYRKRGHLPQSPLKVVAFRSFCAFVDAVPSGRSGFSVAAATKHACVITSSSTRTACVSILQPRCGSGGTS